MTYPTKTQVDALVDNLATNPGEPCYVRVCQYGPNILRTEVEKHLYLAAGLNADGSEKAKVARVKAHLIGRHGEQYAILCGTWDGTTFTPGGAP